MGGPRLLGMQDSAHVCFVYDPYSVSSCVGPSRRASARVGRSLSGGDGMHRHRHGSAPVSLRRREPAFDRAETPRASASVVNLLRPVPEAIWVGLCRSFFRCGSVCRFESATGGQRRLGSFYVGRGGDESARVSWSRLASAAVGVRHGARLQLACMGLHPTEVACISRSRNPTNGAQKFRDSLGRPASGCAGMRRPPSACVGPSRTQLTLSSLQRPQSAQTETSSMGHETF